MMMAKWWSLVVAFVFLAAGGVGCDGSPAGGRVAVETEIVSFEVSPGLGSPGGVVTLSWAAVHAGHIGGVPYCTLQWAVRDREPEELLVVACEGSIEVVLPEVETSVQFQFSALRQGGAGYETRSRTVTVVGDVFAPIQGYVVPAAQVAHVTTVSGTIHGHLGGAVDMSLVSEDGALIIDVSVDETGRFEVLLPPEPELDVAPMTFPLCGGEMPLVAVEILVQHDGPYGPGMVVNAFYERMRPVVLADSETPNDDTTVLRVAYLFSERVVQCTSVIVDEDVDPAYRIDHSVHLRPGWNVVFGVVGTFGDEFLQVLRTGDPGVAVPWIEQMIGAP